MYKRRRKRAFSTVSKAPKIVRQTYSKEIQVCTSQTFAVSILLPVRETRWERILSQSETAARLSCNAFWHVFAGALAHVFSSGCREVLINSTRCILQILEILPTAKATASTSDFVRVLQLVHLWRGVRNCTHSEQAYALQIREPSVLAKIDLQECVHSYLQQLLLQPSHLHGAHMCPRP